MKEEEIEVKNKKRSKREKEGVDDQKKRSTISSNWKENEGEGGGDSGE